MATKHIIYNFSVYHDAYGAEEGRVSIAYHIPNCLATVAEALTADTANYGQKYFETSFEHSTKYVEPQLTLAAYHMPGIMESTEYNKGRDKDERARYVIPKSLLNGMELSEMSGVTMNSGSYEDDGHTFDYTATSITVRLVDSAATLYQETQGIRVLDLCFDLTLNVVERGQTYTFEISAPNVAAEASSNTVTITSSDVSNIGFDPSHSTAGISCTVNGSTATVTFPQNQSGTSNTYELCLTGVTSGSQTVSASTQFTQSGFSYTFNVTPASGNVPADVTSEAFSYTITGVDPNTVGYYLAGSSNVSGCTVDKNQKTGVVGFTENSSTSQSRTITLALSGTTTVGTTVSATTTITQSANAYQFELSAPDVTAEASSNTVTITSNGITNIGFDQSHSVGILTCNVNGSSATVTFPQNTDSGDYTYTVCLTGRTEGGQTVSATTQFTQSGFSYTFTITPTSGNVAAEVTSDPFIFAVTNVDPATVGYYQNGSSNVTGCTVDGSNYTGSFSFAENSSYSQARTITLALTGTTTLGTTVSATTTITQGIKGDDYTFSLAPRSNTIASTATTAVFDITSTNVQNIGFYSGESSNVNSCSINSSVATANIGTNSGSSNKPIKLVLSGTTNGGNTVYATGTTTQVGAVIFTIQYTGSTVSSDSGTTNKFKITTQNATVTGYTVNNGASIAASSTTSVSISYPANGSTSSNVTYTVTMRGRNNMNQVITTSCTFTQEAYVPPTPAYEIRAYFGSGSDYNYSASTSNSGSTTGRVITTNQNWTYSTEDWVRVTPSSGEDGTTTITISWDENTDSSERTARITFNGSEGSQSTIYVGYDYINLYQPGSTPPPATSLDAYFGSQGTTSTGVSSGASYVTATVKSEGQTWGVKSTSGNITNVTPTSGSAGTTNVRIDYSKNDYGFPVESTVVLSGSTSGTVTLTITQSKNPNLPDGYAWFLCYVCGGTNDSITVETGTSVEIYARYADSNFDVHTLTSIPASNWIDEGTSSASANVTKSGTQFYFNKSTTGTTDLHATYNGYRTSNSITIITTGVTPEEFYWDNGETAKTINLDWDDTSISEVYTLSNLSLSSTVSASPTASWITNKSLSNTSNNGTFTATVSQNTDGANPRTTQLQVKKYGSSTVVGVLNISQAKKPVEQHDLLISTGTVAQATTSINYSTPGYASGNTSVLVLPTGQTWTASSSVNWLSATPSSGPANTSTFVTVEWTGNTGSGRNGTITFTGSKGDVAYFNVSQGGISYNLKLYRDNTDVTNSSTNVSTTGRGSFNIKVVSENQSSWSTSFSDSSWISCNPNSGSDGETTVAISFDVNTGAERSSTITFTGGHDTVTLTVIQTGHTFEYRNLVVTVDETPICSTCETECHAYADYYIDGSLVESHRDVTTNTTWSITSGASYGSIASDGTFTANNTSTSLSRTVRVKGTFNDLSNTVDISINPRTVTHTITVLVTPDPIDYNGTGQATASYNTFVDGDYVSSSTVTTSASWSITSGGSYATVGNTSGTKGRITGTNSTASPQTVTVQAVYLSTTGDTTVVINGIPTRTVRVNPTNIKIEHGNLAIAEGDIVSFVIIGRGGTGEITFSNNRVEPGAFNQYTASGYITFDNIPITSGSVELEVSSINFERDGHLYGSSSVWSSLDFETGGGGTAIIGDDYAITVDYQSGSAGQTTIVNLPGGNNPDLIYDYW